jgi:hypothetical protein
MPSYDLYIWTKNSRVKYSRSLNAASIEAAHSIALRLAQVFIEVGPSSDQQSIATCGEFTVKVIDEAGQTVLAVPGRWMGPYLERAKIGHRHNY